MQWTWTQTWTCSWTRIWIYLKKICDIDIGLLQYFVKSILELFPTWKSGASWPAQRSNRSTRRNAVSHICAYMYMLCHTPMMLTCIKVLRPLIVVKGGLNVWNTSCWNKQHVAGWDKANITGWATCSSMERKSVLPQDEAEMDTFARCCRG